MGMKANLSLPYKHAGPARRKQRGVVSKPLLSTLPDYSTEGRGYENSLSHRHFIRFLEKDGALVEVPLLYCHLESRRQQATSPVQTTEQFAIPDMIYADNNVRNSCSTAEGAARR